MRIITIQAIFLIAVLGIIYAIYPRTSLELSGNVVNFKTLNAELIIISANPDFSNPRFIEIRENENLTFDLQPGKYYWKSSNNLIEGLKHEFTIESEVAMKINEEENESDLVNIGNVKINVTKNKEGTMVGHIILEPEQAEKIENENEKYVGRQE